MGLIGLAEVALVTGDAGHTERLLDEANSILRHAGPCFGSPASYVRAVLAIRRRNPDQAITLARESLIRIRDP